MKQQTIEGLCEEFTPEQLALEVVKLRGAVELWKRSALTAVGGGIDSPKHQLFDVLAAHTGTRELIIYTVEAANKVQAFDKAAIEAGVLAREVEFIACVPAGLLYSPSDKPVIGSYYLG